MPDEFVPNDDFDSILRPKRKIEADPAGATPNEVAAGLAEADQIVPDPDRPSGTKEQAEQNA